MRLPALLLVASLVASCQSGQRGEAAANAVVPVDLSAWTPEDIPLPPGFAPGMPGGRERLLFAPGWRAPEAEDFWCYVLLMEMEVADVDAERLEGLFEQYFDGLIGAVGEGKPFELPADPAQVSFRHLGDARYAGLVETWDAFTTGNALALHLLVDVEPTSVTTTQLRVRASPVPPGESAVWFALEQALASLAFE